jgi:hypothetical protein
MRNRWIFYYCMVFVMQQVMVGCASQPKSTVISADDAQFVVTKTAEKLKTSAFLADRKSDSPPITITLEKVENLTSDVISEAEQWKFLMEIQGSLDVVKVANSKNIHFQVTPERLAKLRSQGWTKAGSAYQPPTHVMSAVFHSAARAGQDKEGLVTDRVDQYFLEYSIVELKTGAVAWSDSVEFKKEAIGRVNN